LRVVNISFSNTRDTELDFHVLPMTLICMHTNNSG